MPSSFWRGVFRFDRSRIAPEIAIRNSIGVAIPLIAGAALGNVSAGVVGALGALNVSFSDSRDPYILRVRRMLTASVLVATAVIVGALVGNYNAASILAVGIGAFAMGMLAVLGQKPADLGTTTLSTLIVFTSRSLTITEALEAGLIAFASALLQMGLSVALWPVKPWEPERQLIGKLYAELARVATSPAGADAAPPASSVMTSTQETFGALTHERSAEAERLVYLVTQSERIRMALLTLRRLCRRLARDPGGGPLADAVRRILMEASTVLPAIGASANPSLDSFNAAVNSLRELTSAVPPDATAFLTALAGDARRQAEALGGRLRATLGPAPRALPPVADPFDRVARLTANLSFHSTAFRHAVRLAVTVATGDALARLGLNPHDIQRTYWVPMTAGIILKPDFTTTFTRGVLRIAGTLTGLFVATVLFHHLHTGPATDIALIAAFTLFLRWLGPGNYGLFTMAISGIVVLLVAITGVDPQPAIAARALNTLIGGALAMAAYGIWPTWEQTRVGPILADLLGCYRAYFNNIILALEGAPHSPLDALRLRARLARSNAEASVARLQAEPNVRPEVADRVGAMLTTSHAFGRAALALESGVYQTKPSPVRPATREFAGKVNEMLLAMESALRELKPLPRDLPDLRAAWVAIERTIVAPTERYTLINTETDRIAVALNTLQEQAAGFLRRTQNKPDPVLTSENA